ncbi:MAG: ATP-binding cassette domain-containing protein [Spirochaetales bacterium]|nr:ATP-binding cassette domain-containing protein [Spirochaetales bacterium]
MSDIAIGIENVTKTYHSLIAVKSIGFEVPKSTCFGLLGPNGAGKTTMMKMLYGKAGRDPGPEGKISIFGFDPAMDELKIKYISGIVPQENNLDDELNVEQNLFIYSKFYGMNRKEAGKRIDGLLDFMELSVKRKAAIDELSGGMKRRLIIARALLNNPKILILDEPTTGLDPQVRHIIWDKLRILKKEGVTILLTTHYMEEAFQLCDRLIIMNLGEKILEGSPSTLIRNNIEPYVLEIYDTDHEETDRGKKTSETIPVRMEKTASRILLYSENLGRLEEISSAYKQGSFYLRQSNLEDVFLKITGRGLNE